MAQHPLRRLDLVEQLGLVLAAVDPLVQIILEGLGDQLTRTIVTCEEIVSDEFIRRDPTKTRIFGECVQAVVKAPYGAWPSQCYAYYDDDDAGLKEYDKASKYQDAEDAVKQLEKAAVKARSGEDPYRR